MAADGETAEDNAILDEIEALTKRAREIQDELSITAETYADDALWDELKSVGERIKALDKKYTELSEARYRRRSVSRI